jgi:GNAT superfamily N-acetyltransferase
MRTNLDLEIKLRKCTQADYDWCHKLSEENMGPYVNKHWRGWDPKLFSDNFIVERTMIVEVNDEPIGFYEIEVKDRLGIIYGIQICESYRNKGIGTKIMGIIEDEFRSKGAITSKLRVFVDNPAVRLYKRLGYASNNEADSYAKPGTIILEKHFF